MTIASHLQELRRKHETLSDMVEKAQRSPGTDDLKIADTEEAKAENQGRDQPPVALLKPSRSRFSGAGAGRQCRACGDQRRSRQNSG